MKTVTIKHAVGLFTASLILSAGLFACTSADTESNTETSSTEVTATETTSTETTTTVDGADTASSDRPSAPPDGNGGGSAPGGHALARAHC